MNAQHFRTRAFVAHSLSAMIQPRFAYFCLLALLFTSCAVSKPAAESTRFDGESLFEVRLLEAEGRVEFAFPAPDADGVLGEYVYVSSLGRGLGANAVGLDRGQLGPSRIVQFRVVGNRVLFEERNLGYRADSSDPDQERATRESFATSILWAGTVSSRTKSRVEFDATSLVVRDAHRSARALARTNQGQFTLDPTRSSLDTSACVALPDNVELGAILTFACESPGEHVQATAPTPDSVTLLQHHSLIRLPDTRYQPREWDPRSGSFSIQYTDTTAAIGEANDRRLAARFRLRKKNQRGEVIEPIIYYVDRGAPEPIRSALLDGARWWTAAFEAAGFRGAYRVELLPEGVNPLDVRYNVIQWVHRSTRGWSYGGGISDPRTGEMITGRVTLGSLRVRQDRLLFEGLLSADATGSGGANDPTTLALARIRQLAAHEVGHTLGLAHNFAASTCDRASVMDYPAPLVRLKENGELDLSKAYAVGIGTWDELAIRWLYEEFSPNQDERAALDAIISEGIGRGLRYFSDNDARPAGAALPAASLWDNGSNPALELREVLRVRSAALAKFGERNVAVGRPLAELEEVLAPLYFSHRYQLTAAAKMIGGIEWRHALRGSERSGVEPITGSDQLRALDALLETITPEALDIPESVLQLLLPRPPDTSRHVELFASGSLPMFDALGAAETAARLTFDEIFQAERCARIIDQSRRDSSILVLEEVFETVLLRVFPPNLPANSRTAALVLASQRALVASLLDLAGSAATPTVVRVEVEQALQRASNLMDEPESSQDHYLQRVIARFLSRETETFVNPIPPSEPPPGSPIGCGMH